MSTPLGARPGRVPLAQVEQQLLARWPEIKVNPTLDRIERLLDLLDRPHCEYRSVHLTGTNGKTSTARMVEALLAASGLETGRLTSPHLTSIRERICLNEEAVSVPAFLSAYAAVAEHAERVEATAQHPFSFFEMTVAMAYRAFADHGVDVAVVEVGMGGLWDATNVIDAEVAAILPIDLDHSDYLGPTRADIAREKSGIIKPGAVAVSARQSEDAACLLRARANEVGARLVMQDDDFSLLSRTSTEYGQLISIRGLMGAYDDVCLSLRGPHQADNAAVAVATAEALLGRPLDDHAVRTALRRVSSPGRFEIRPGTPPVILDAAHNPHGARALVRSLTELPPGRTVAVVAAMADKDYRELLRELDPVIDAVVCTRNSSPRSLPSEELAACARQVMGEDRVFVAPDVESALEAADTLCASSPGRPSEARVVVTGSVVTVGDAARALPGSSTQRGSR